MEVVRDDARAKCELAARISSFGLFLRDLGVLVYAVFLAALGDDADGFVGRGFGGENNEGREAAEMIAIVGGSWIVTGVTSRRTARGSCPTSPSSKLCRAWPRGSVNRLNISHHSVRMYSPYHVHLNLTTQPIQIFALSFYAHKK